ncbi:HNH endonuclease [Natronoarchaeum sp. GCM10025703]
MFIIRSQYENSEAPAEAHSLENLITLCRSCHRLAEEASIMVSAETEK